MFFILPVPFLRLRKGEISFLNKETLNKKRVALVEKTKESAYSVLPIVIIVTLL